jgi:hypothetical protein
LARVAPAKDLSRIGLRADRMRPMTARLEEIGTPEAKMRATMYATAYVGMLRVSEYTTKREASSGSLLVSDITRTTSDSGIACFKLRIREAKACDRADPRRVIQ